MCILIRCNPLTNWWFVVTHSLTDFSALFSLCWVMQSSEISRELAAGASSLQWNLWKQERKSQFGYKLIGTWLTQKDILRSTYCKTKAHSNLITGPKSADCTVNDQKVSKIVCLEDHLTSHSPQLQPMRLLKDFSWMMSYCLPSLLILYRKPWKYM